MQIIKCIYFEINHCATIPDRQGNTDWGCLCEGILFALQSLWIHNTSTETKKSSNLVSFLFNCRERVESNEHPSSFPILMVNIKDLRKGFWVKREKGRDMTINHSELSCREEIEISEGDGQRREI